MRRDVYTQEHEDFRAMIRAFIESEVVPVYDKWFEDGIAPRDFYYKLGELGLFGIEYCRRRRVARQVRDEGTKPS